MIKILKTFYSFLFAYKKYFFVFMSFLIVSILLDNIVPYIYKFLVNAILSEQYRLSTFLILAFVAARYGSTFTEAVSHYFGNNKVLFLANRDSRLKVFKKIQDLDFAYHVDKSTGQLISIFKRGFEAFTTLYLNIHYTIFNVFISLIVILLSFLRISPIIALIMFLVTIGNIFFGWQLIKFNMKKRRLYNDSEDKITGVIVDNLINYETVKFFAQEKNEEKRLKFEFKDWIKKWIDYSNSFFSIDIFIGALSNAGSLIIFWIVVGMVKNDQITVGDLVLVIGFMGMFYFKFFALIRNLREIAKNYTDLEVYFSILDNEILVKDPFSPTKVNKINGEVSFDNISFKYPDGKNNVLTNFSFKIKENETVAFVSRSGEGKTTAIKLLLRFYDVNKGKITIDGTDIKDLTKSQLRSLIGIVPQEPILFNNTIGFNIAYGKNKASQAEIEKVAKMAHLHQFINSLPDKYKTQVGERGIKLSGGQKQRLAIARMLLTDPKIVVFDEATSQLDSESEKYIQEALWKFAKEKTVLIIAHRLSTIKKADKIAVLNEGKVAEIGTHAELVKKKKIYSYLWQLQSQGEII